jgi:hypothetical protein
MSSKHQALVLSAILTLGCRGDDSGRRAPAPAPASAVTTATAAENTAIAISSATPIPPAAARDGEIEPPAVAAAKGRRTWVPARDVAPPPDDASPRPSKQDWEGAPEATEVRVTDPSCKAQRVREWYRISCETKHISLLGGSRTDVDVGRSDDPYAAWIIFPARRGDRRVFLFSRVVKYGYAPDAVFSEQWLPGDAAPLMSLQGIL